MTKMSQARVDILKFATVPSPSLKTRIMITPETLRAASSNGMCLLIECDCPASEVAITYDLEANLRAGSPAPIGGLPGRIG